MHRPCLVPDRPAALGQPTRDRARWFAAAAVLSLMITGATCTTDLRAAVRHPAVLSFARTHADALARVDDYAPTIAKR